MLRFNTKQQLVEALQARRPWAVRHDEITAAEHHVAEQKVLTEFKAQCESLGKMTPQALKSYITGKRTAYRWAKLIEVELPSCPASAVTRLEQTLEYLEATRQEKFVLSGDHGDSIPYAHWLLTASNVKRKATVCN